MTTPGNIAVAGVWLAVAGDHLEVIGLIGGESIILPLICFRYHCVHKSV